MRPVALLTALLLVGACKANLPNERPQLDDLEEPFELRTEPDDEVERLALPLGGFTGINVAAAPRTLESFGGDDEGLRVSQVVENSPGDAAGIQEDDLLLEAVLPDGRVTPLRWASEWRQVELDAEPGTQLEVTYDRGGVEHATTVGVVRRVRATPRRVAERFREDARVGVVLRRATEVEARGGGLPPGGGAVVVGLSRRSPWRAEGPLYGDVIVRVDDEPVAHPQVLLEAIRDADPGDELDIEFTRNGELHEVEAAVTRREQELTRFRIPLLFSYENTRAETDLWMLLGLIRRQSTETSWSWRFLWFIQVEGGDANLLVEDDG